MTRPGRPGAVVVAGLAAGLAAAAPAGADPIGAVVATSELAVTGGGPRQRVGASATGFVTRRVGVHLALAHATLDGAAGQVTAGLAYRAAAARPRLELVVHADAGLAWPTAPVAGAGVIAFLWPTRLPVALTTGVRGYAILDGLADSRLAISLELGLALAR